MKAYRITVLSVLMGLFLMMAPAQAAITQFSDSGAFFTAVRASLILSKVIDSQDDFDLSNPVFRFPPLAVPAPNDLPPFPTAPNGPSTPIVPIGTVLDDGGPLFDVLDEVVVDPNGVPSSGDESFRRRTGVVGFGAGVGTDVTVDSAAFIFDGIGFFSNGTGPGFPTDASISMRLVPSAGDSRAARAVGFFFPANFVMELYDTAGNKFFTSEKRGGAATNNFYGVITNGSTPAIARVVLTDFTDGLTFIDEVFLGFDGRPRADLVVDFNSVSNVGGGTPGRNFSFIVTNQGDNSTNVNTYLTFMFSFDGVLTPFPFYSNLFPFPLDPSGDTFSMFFNAVQSAGGVVTVNTRIFVPVVQAALGAVATPCFTLPVAALGPGASRNVVLRFPDAVRSSNNVAPATYDFRTVLNGRFLIAAVDEVAAPTAAIGAAFPAGVTPATGIGIVTVNPLTGGSPIVVGTTALSVFPPALTPAVPIGPVFGLVSESNELNNRTSVVIGP